MPTHGVIILDSSAQKISDLLDIVISCIMFSVNAVWSLKQQELQDSSDKLSQSFTNFLEADTLDPDTLVQFEFELLHDLIKVYNNEEMSKLFVNNLQIILIKQQ
ncbi:hypothetical protein ACFQZT_17825 [Paenibacillus sp. GCM10027628]|uniref:hypothetical protein n=1 Tax=Paenibacillus sp. GCM10027628 TaxID=3273413 RepID=UPI00363A71E9